MNKKILNLALLVTLTASPVFAMAKGPSLPPNAVEVSNGVFSLGKAYDAKSDSFVEGYAIVHKKSDAKGSVSGNARKASSKCYGVLASGAKWKDLEDWSVFPANSGLDNSFLLANTAANIGKWEDAAKNYNILGTGSLGVGTPSDPYTLDDKNEVSFGDLDPGTIAVTVIWGTFSGPTFARQLAAWDQIFNTDYQWSDNGDPAKMDYENISTHELGHAMGMADIYDSSCSEVTMYGYGTYGETQKRTLAPADITGIKTLY